MRLQTSAVSNVRVRRNEIYRQRREMAGWVHDLMLGDRPIKVVVGVSRGGLPFAATLASEFNIGENTETIGVNSYRGLALASHPRSPISNSAC